MFAIFLTIFLAGIGVLGDYYINLAGERGKMDIKWFVVGLIIYASTAFGWYFAMKHIKLSTLGVFYAVSTVLFLAFISVAYFKEPLNQYELIGILVAIASLFLLGRFA